ncbi:MAG TPA: hypothetical protein VGJ30_19705 [Candidatus Angelobacter sp.]|jgi:hypothetical protein
MSLKDWERDVLNRQRNIVFPDTNLNEGRYYRHIASGKAIFSVGQKVSLLIIVLFVTIITSWGLAQTIASIIAQPDLEGKVIGLWGCIYLLAILLFWIFLGVKGLVPASPVRKRRRGYRQSSKA